MKRIIVSILIIFIGNLGYSKEVYLYSGGNGLVNAEVYLDTVSDNFVISPTRKRFYLLADVSIYLMSFIGSDDDHFIYKGLLTYKGKAVSTKINLPMDLINDVAIKNYLLSGYFFIDALNYSTKTPSEVTYVQENSELGEKISKIKLIDDSFEK